MNKNCIISLIIFLNNIIKEIPDGNYLNIKNNTNTTVSEIIYYYLKNTKNNEYNFDSIIDEKVFKLINKISIKHNIYNEFITILIIILQNFGKISNISIDSYFKIIEKSKFYKSKILKNINSINELEESLYQRYYEKKSEKHNYLYLDLDGNDIESLINNKQKYKINNDFYKHNKYNYNNIVILYLPRFSYNNKIIFNRKNIKINYNLHLNCNNYKLLSLIYYDDNSNCKFCCLENQDKNLLINDNDLKLLKKDEKSKFLNLIKIEDTCLYLIYQKSSEIKMYSFDFDGVVHTSVKEVDNNGFRSNNHTKNKIIFKNVIFTIKKLLEMDNIYINFISHNKHLMNDIKPIFNKEKIDLSKIEFNILKWREEKSKIIKNKKSNVFIDDSPAIINECITGNNYGYFENPLTIYYSIPELFKFIKINEKNTNLVKKTPKIPINIIKKLDNNINEVNLSLKIISYNICYQAILHKEEGSAKDLGKVCKKIGEEYERYICKDNIINIILKTDYDFIGIVEGNLEFINELIDLLEEKYKIKYDFVVGNSEEKSSSVFIVYKKSRFTSTDMKKNGYINNDKLRPFVSDLFLDKYSQEIFNIMLLHAPHEEYDTELEISNGINENLDNLIVMGDFNKEINYDLKINDSNLNTINKNKNTCCFNNIDKSLSDNYIYKSDNILVNNNFNVEIVEYLDSKSNILIEKNSDKLKYTSDHSPICIKLNKKIFLEDNKLINENDLLEILFEDTTNLNNVLLVDEISF